MGTEVRVAENVEPRRGGIAGALFSKVQRRVLGILFGDAHRSFYVNEILSMANVGAGAVHRVRWGMELENAFGQGGLADLPWSGQQDHLSPQVGDDRFLEVSFHDDEYRPLSKNVKTKLDIHPIMVSPRLSQPESTMFRCP